jgi:hypothetical protein
MIKGNNYNIKFFSGSKNQKKKQSQPGSEAGKADKQLSLSGK